MDLERRDRGIKRSSVLSTRGKKWFFPPGRRADGKKKKPKSVHGENEGGQARVTRRIEYLRGTPFAWKIERCSSIKGASYTRRKITKPRKEFVRRFCCFLSLSLSFFSFTLNFNFKLFGRRWRQTIFPRLFVRPAPGKINRNNATETTVVFSIFPNARKNRYGDTDARRESIRRTKHGTGYELGTKTEYLTMNRERRRVTTELTRFTWQKVSVYVWQMFRNC